MRWTKHLSMAHADKAMALILEEFGAEGYGVYWLMIEDIAAPMEKEKIDPSATHSWVKWSQICHCSVRHFRSIVCRMEEKSLISIQTVDDRIQITISNILKYKDEYSKKSGHTPEQEQKRTDTYTDTPKAPAPDGASAGLFSLESPNDNKPAKETKPDPIADWFAREFWPLYPRKDDKEKALRAARKALPGSKPSEVLSGLRRQLPDFLRRMGVDRSKVPLPSTWLNGKRWRDELGAEEQVPPIASRSVMDDRLSVLDNLKPRQSVNG